MSEQRAAAQDSIAQLDLRRDEEIATLLAKLGVSVAGSAGVAGGWAASADESDVADEDEDDDDSGTEESDLEEDSETDSETEDSDSEDAEKDDDLDALLGGL